MKSNLYISSLLESLYNTRDGINALITNLEKENKTKQVINPPPLKSSSERILVKFPTPPGTKWEDISIIFIDGETVKITVGSICKTKTYSQMGFMNTKNGKPNKQWNDLEDIAGCYGMLSWDTPSKDLPYKRKKRKQLIADTLKSFFNLPDDPFYPYMKGSGWKTRFNISSKE